jgi:hypothetical protein
LFPEPSKLLKMYILYSFDLRTLRHSLSELASDRVKAIVRISFLFL